MAQITKYNYFFSNEPHRFYAVKNYLGNSILKFLLDNELLLLPAHAHVEDGADVYNEEQGTDHRQGQH